jgi:hypothetical protein
MSVSSTLAGPRGSKAASSAGRTCSWAPKALRIEKVTARSGTSDRSVL